MPTHDIIDNRKEKLVDHINRSCRQPSRRGLPSATSSSPGLRASATTLAGVKELRLLIGNTTNRETLEQMAEGYRRLELVAEAAEAEAFPKTHRHEADGRRDGGEHPVVLELMDQTDEARSGVDTLCA